MKHQGIDFVVQGQGFCSDDFIKKIISELPLKFILESSPSNKVIAEGKAVESGYKGIDIYPFNIGSLVVEGFENLHEGYSCHVDEEDTAHIFYDFESTYIHIYPFEKEE